jgi:hypothetical protein
MAVNTSNDLIQLHFEPFGAQTFLYDLKCVCSDTFGGYCMHIIHFVAIALSPHISGTGFWPVE